MPVFDSPWDPALVRPALTLLSGRWVVSVLLALDPGPLRRGLLRDRLPGISDKILTDTLRRMEANNLVIRSVVPSVPIEVDYGLTQYGRSLWPVLSRLHDWAADSPKPPVPRA